MIKKFPLLLSLLLLGTTFKGHATDYILKQGTAEGLASDSTNWTTDGVTPLIGVSISSLALTSVNATKLASGALVTFAATQAVNIASYTIESSNSGNNFTAIATLATTATLYNYTDAAVTGTVYYRIKAIDKNGKVTYSVIVSLQASTGLTVAVYPNPATNYLLVNATLAVSVVNAACAVVSAPIVLINAGLYQVNVAA